MHLTFLTFILRSANYRSMSSKNLISVHYLRKLKIQIFCRYSADVKENANKLHFKCTDFNSSRSVIVYAERIYVLTEYLKYLSIRRHSYSLFSSIKCEKSPFNFCVVAFGDSMYRNFFNSLLTSRFVQLFSGNSSVNLFLCTPSNTNFLSKSYPRR